MCYKYQNRLFIGKMTTSRLLILKCLDKLNFEMKVLSNIGKIETRNDTDGRKIWIICLQSRHTVRQEHYCSQATFNGFQLIALIQNGRSTST